MSRYIDVNMLIKKYIDTDIKKFSNSDAKIVLENLKQNILKAPSVDIVRCKECKHWERKADRKTENSSEKPNNSTISKMEQVEGEPTEITYQNCSDALLKMWMGNVLTDAEYNRIMDKLNTEIAKAIVHKMIDDAVLAEDAYPDLRQKMHDAVDEYEPQTGRNE